MYYVRVGSEEGKMPNIQPHRQTSPLLPHPVARQPYVIKLLPLNKLRQNHAPKDAFMPRGGANMLRSSLLKIAYSYSLFPTITSPPFPPFPTPRTLLIGGLT